jgi:Ca2+-binding RTX toxin-like protein
MNININRSSEFSGNWTIDLKAGNDVINSGKVKNTDSIDLGSGNDSISLMLGADAGGVQTISNANLALLDGGTGVDTIRYDESTNTSGTISLSTSGATNFENIVGSPGAETITGDANDNVIAGGNYGGTSTVADTLNGEAGNDLLIASYNTTGLCNDCFNAIPYNNPIANLFSKSNHETFTYSSSYYFSTSASHIFNGGAGDDVILGGKGNETFNGGTGKDYMHGGLGIDTFVIKSGDGSTTLADADVVYDFTDGTDLIGMSGLEYSQLTIEQGTGDYANHVVVKKTDTGEFLVIIQNTSLSSISNADFSAI